MTLGQIRQLSKIADLKLAIKYLCDNKKEMAISVFFIYSGTIESQGAKLGVSRRELNALAKQYQQFGVMEVSSDTRTN